MPRASSTEPRALRPFLFHGLALEWRDGEGQAHADCPWCGRESKLSVNLDTGLWRCHVCQEGDGGGGNAMTFLRMLWERSDAQTNGKLRLLADDLRLVYPDSLMRWGVCWSVLGNCWLIPGHGADGKLNQLYKYVQVGDRWTAMPTPEMHHQLHGIMTWEKDRTDVHLCEGWKDGVAWWEALKHAKPDGDDYRFTASELSSVLSTTNVLALSSCGGVGRPLEKFAPLFAGRRVTLLLDSDHPKLRCQACEKSHSTVLHKVCPDCGGELTGQLVRPAGFEATKRAARLLSSMADPPAEVLWCRWGAEGFDPALKDGWDVRDSLSATVDPQERAKLVRDVMRRIEPVPPDWLGKSGTGVVEHASQGMDPEPCSEWAVLVNAWKKALRWRQEIEDVLSVMLAVALSTEQEGDQLFLQLIAPPGSAKSRLCDAMLVSRHCFALEHLTGFHSGYRDSSGEDFSLLNRINNKTLITPEGDVIMSSPRFVEIMSQQRRIFDGASGAIYKNSKADVRHTGLRTPWIMAGTPALMNSDQSRLGDRFIRICINPPSDEEKSAIVRKAGHVALQSLLQSSNGQAESHVSPNMAAAYKLTGGYVDWLRGDPTELLSRVGHDSEWVVDRCGTLAEFTALMRARPDPDHKKEVHDSAELPTRLTSQFVRLAGCLAVVLNRWNIDDEVLRIVGKVAMDTAKGTTMNIARALHECEKPRDGMSMAGLAVKIKSTTDRTETLVRFLRHIRVVEMFQLKVGKGTHNRLRLTSRMTHLWEQVAKVQGRVEHAQG